MPDQHPYAQRRPARLPGESQPVGEYAELHCLTNYSFLEGASHPDELVCRAAELGLSALAITDRNSLAGVVKAHLAAQGTSLKLLIGAEITPLDAAPIVLLAASKTGYTNLSHLITQGRRHADKGECRLTLRDVAEHAGDLLACIPMQHRPDAALRQHVQTFQQQFSDRCYGLVELHHGPDDRLLLDQLCRFAGDVALPLAAANHVHYHCRNRQMLQDTLTAIRHGCTVAELGHRRFVNAERVLKSATAMQALFAARPELITRTKDIANQCHFSLDELRYQYPVEACPDGLQPFEYLQSLTWDGAKSRYPDGIPDHVRRLITHELGLIEELNYEAYFLTVHDVVTFARSRDILCQGRGSAANSAVCFCLGITEVDPDRIDVLFERFVSRERNEPPDIDIDFEHHRREEVIQFVYEKYGRDCAAMTASVTTYRPRSAVRDVGKALGYSEDFIIRLSKSMDHTIRAESLHERFPAAANGSKTKLEQYIRLVREVQHFPRHLSQHPGGMVMTNCSLADYVPIENAAMPDRTVVQWDKDDLDALGILKVDLLGLGMLSAIRRCFEIIRQHYGHSFTLATIPAEDPAVYEMISNADTIGVFQIESRAQMAMLPRLRPQCFYDLVIEVAIVRPGPIQGDMVHPYLRRRCGDEPVEYADERIKSVLQRTLGVPIFQEQAMKLAVVAAGFTPGEADQLRKAMGAWRKQGLINQFREKLITGMQNNGYDTDFAERVFRQIQGFGEYGFPESHAASFALLVYVSAWLKHYYPAAFTAALLNSLPMGFYAPAQLISDVRKHGVIVFPVDVGFSSWESTLEQCRSGETALRLGFHMLSGFPGEIAERICQVRDRKPFQSFEDFRSRVGLSSAMLAILSNANAFRSLKSGRRQSLWQALPDQSEQPLFDGMQQPDQTQLPLMSEQGQIVVDYQTTGLSLRGHPLAEYRWVFHQRNVTPARDLSSLADDTRVRVAGLVLIRQHPSSAKGVTFMTLEDETGTINLIIQPDVWNRFRSIARTSAALIARGQLQNQQNVIHVRVDWMDDLSNLVQDANLRSRDFR